jgi:glutaconate CoA-transferase subunit A
MAEIVSLGEAIERTVRDGDTVAMEGFTHLIPFAAGQEVIRQRRRDLTLIRMTPDLIYDQLIGAATPVSARCTGSATRSSTRGRSRWR